MVRPWGTPAEEEVGLLLIQQLEYLTLLKVVAVVEELQAV